MINFDEEIKNYEPSLEIEMATIQEAIARKKNSKVGSMTAAEINSTPTEVAAPAPVSYTHLWILFQLFDTQRHLTFFAIQSQNYSFYFVTDFHEVLCRTQML